MALAVDDDIPPFANVVIEGTVTISEVLEDLRHWAERIAARYMGAEQAEAFGARNGVPGELLVRVRPQRVTVKRRSLVEYCCTAVQASRVPGVECSIAKVRHGLADIELRGQIHIPGETSLPEFLTGGT